MHTWNKSTYPEICICWAEQMPRAILPCFPFYCHDRCPTGTAPAACVPHTLKKWLSKRKQPAESPTFMLILHCYNMSTMRGISLDLAQEKNQPHNISQGHWIHPPMHKPLMFLTCISNVCSKAKYLLQSFQSMWLKYFYCIPTVMGQQVFTAVHHLIGKWHCLQTSGGKKINQTQQHSVGQLSVDTLWPEEGKGKKEGK